MYNMQHVLASFFSLKTTCQSDKNSSISIQLYLSAHKRLQNGLKKKKKAQETALLFAKIPQSSLQATVCAVSAPSPEGPWLVARRGDLPMLFLDARSSKPKWCHAACQVWLVRCRCPNVREGRRVGYRALFPRRNGMLLPWCHQSFTEELTGRQWWLRN